MTTAIALVSAVVLIVGGMACIAAGMPCHHEMLGRKAPAAARLRHWRLAGGLLLAMALPPCGTIAGVGIGIVLWSGLLTAGVLAVAGALAAWSCSGQGRGRERDGIR